MKIKKNLIERAVHAYWISLPKGTPLPDAKASDIHDVGGIKYVVVRSADSIYAVYRVRKDNGKLIRLMAPPKGLSII